MEAVGWKGDDPRPCVGVARAWLGAPAAEATSCELAVGTEAEGRLCGQKGPVEEVDGGGDEAMAGRKVGVAVDVEVVTPRAGGSEASAVRTPFTVVYR